MFERRISVGYHKQFYSLKVKRVYTQNFQSHHVVTPCSICIGILWSVREWVKQRCGEKGRKGCPDSWWYMYIRTERKSNVSGCDDDQQQEEEKKYWKIYSIWAHRELISRSFHHLGWSLVVVISQYLIPCTRMRARGGNAKNCKNQNKWYLVNFKDSNLKFSNNF